jgi:putative SOS response-associated peptidase YedK
MCGRFVLTSNPDVIQTTFNLDSVPAGLSARYNIAPSQPVAVITNEKSRELTFYRWGLIPSWAKDASMGNKMINARAETAPEKPAFRSAFKRRRCLIPADGFYEWQKQADGKVPLFIHLKDRSLFALAGLWEIWHSPDGGEIRTCTILTTEANDFMRPIHDRMPAILRVEDYPLWLSRNEQPVDDLRAALTPIDPSAMAAYPVSRLVNKPGVDAPECIQPVA